MFGSKWSIAAAYTQLMYWQVYGKSPFFRETDYEPRIFVGYSVNNNLRLDFGFDHESNERGGDGKDGMERSWNRMFADIGYSGKN